MRTSNYFRLSLKGLSGASDYFGTLQPLMVALILIVVFSLTFVISCDKKSSTTAVEQVTFHDSSLESSIRKTLNIPRGPIYISNLKFLTGLDLGERSISDLTGLEYCVNLEVLSLDRNKISDISILARLTNLKMLDLQQNNISDISALAGLTNLTVLLLGQNNISDISALAGLTNLDWLSLEQNNISDISALVANSGISAGDNVKLQNNPLSIPSLNIYAPQLREKGLILTPFLCS